MQLTICVYRTICRYSYGNSSKPISENSYAHSKRAWGQDIVQVVDVLFGADTPIIPFGHDRGARLAYRLALDYGEQRVKAAVCLDIVPTIYVWDDMRLEKGHTETKRSHHWVRGRLPAFSKDSESNCSADNPGCASPISRNDDFREPALLLRVHSD